MTESKQQLREWTWYPLHRIRELPHSPWGVFALGAAWDGDTPRAPGYVACAGHDLHREVDIAADSCASHAPTHFAFATTPELGDAFVYACRLYHDFGGPDGRLWNGAHPPPPPRTALHCPSCGATPRA